MTKGGEEGEYEETSDEDEEDSDEEGCQSGGRKSPASPEEAFNLNVSRVEAIIAKYKEDGDPGIYVDDEQIEEKEVGGDPATAGRAKVRRQCKPQGPVWLLLESFHLQAAALDEGYRILQFNQQAIDLVKGPA